MQVLRGTTSVTIGNETFSGEEGDIFFINQEELHRVASEDDQLVYRTVIFPLQALTFSESDASQTYLEQLIQGTQRFPVQLTRKKDCDFLYALLYQIQNAAEQKSSGRNSLTSSGLAMFLFSIGTPLSNRKSSPISASTGTLKYFATFNMHRRQGGNGFVQSPYQFFVFG